MIQVTGASLSNGPFRARRNMVQGDLRRRVGQIAVQQQRHECPRPPTMAKAPAIFRVSGGMRITYS
jgi:hypothetical protein